MDFIKKMFSKKHELSDEEQNKFNNMFDEESHERFSPNEVAASFTSLEEINRMRNCLDKREKELEKGDMYVVNADLSSQDSPDFISDKKDDPYIEEVDDVNPQILDEDHETVEIEDIHKDSKEENNLDEIIETDIPTPNDEMKSDASELDSLIHEIEEDENNETQEEVEKEVEITKDDETSQEEPLVFEESNSDEITPEEKKEVETLGLNSYETETSLFLQKISDIFGSENVLSTHQENLPIDSLRDKKVFHIGIREKSSFGSGRSLSEENSWFISHVKQIENLKEFKMLKSEQGIKDLLLEKENYAILISFKATEFLTSPEDFDFEL